VNITIYGWSTKQAVSHLLESVAARDKCTTATWTGRQLYLRPREIHQAAAARAAGQDITFQADYARRAGIEGTMHKAVAITGSRRAV
jgi:hypothetical protein